MPKPIKQKRRLKDANEVAFDLMRRSTEAVEVEPETIAQLFPPTISEYMAQIGSKGGKIGGKRRMKTMTAQERKKVARRAARARWAKAKNL